MYREGDIWRYASERKLTIVSKDADFSDLVMLRGAPPRVVHICFGNLTLGETRRCLMESWPLVLDNIEAHSLSRIFEDRIESISL